MIFIEYCENLEDAVKLFPELKNCIVTKIQASDGILDIFTVEKLTDDDIKFFEEFTKEEIITVLGLSRNA